MPTLSEPSFLILGPAGHLEVIAHFAAPEAGSSRTVIICHPHPLHGGTMHNKVVTTLVRTFKELNWSTVIFNFRGVGKSEGQFGEGFGEVEDLKAVLQWVQQQKPQDEIGLAGFSFGGFIAATVASETPHIIQLVTVAPQVSRFIEAKTPAITIPWILVVAEQDGIIPVSESLSWYDTLNPKPTLIRIDAGHFFHGKLVELRERLQDALQK